jgi:tRNA dimethylallyltransferase
MTGSRPTLAIGGPTATGKTVLAVELATRIGGELVNADSRQVVRRLFAGTATPTAAELRGVPCHLLGLREPGEPYTVAQWLDDARVALADLDARGVPAVLVGGTGQYLRALREGWDFGGVPPLAQDREEITAQAATALGLRQLADELRERDPEGAVTIDLTNPRRVIRAVELLRAGHGSLAEARRRSGGRDLVLVVLDADRALHREVLAARLEAMFAPGAILAEVAAELASGTGAAALSRAGIGYREAVEVVEGRATVEEARERAAQRTRRYVKAQRTWFRHEAAELRLERTAGTATAALADEVVSLPTLGGWRL